jgi:hypothetical protein
MRYVVFAALIVGCMDSGEPPVPATDVPAAPTDPAAAPADPAAAPAGDALMPALAQGAAIPAAASLPQGWSGSGVLAARDTKLPKKAPKWAQVQAEIADKGGQRILRTSGVAEKIKDGHLARSTAEARARAEMTRWTRSDTLVGSLVVNVWRDPKSGITFAQAELAVPADWVPGQPLPRM